MRSRLANAGVGLWAGLVLLAFSFLYWMQADALPRSSLGGSVGSDGLPKLLGGALAVMSCLLIVQSLLASPEKRQQDREGLPSRLELLRALGFWVIAAGFVLALPWLGYPVAVAAVLLAIGMYYGRRPSAWLIGFALAGAAIFYLLFHTLLGVPVPTGIFMDLLAR
ncbi:tripartite tricarboxylate transporter TctB family protein [Starkeya koreensis]|uniref:Tripartite tricarboxylate transporter TctB family protein n=1 Tax=Ancylobacter koreensis TaxID=266121 RepID=A0ABT0DKH9_9HYPH|nr:tripartite tricarboxylate transporter TctB family protein [Ancylobacter koreensis]MCK0207796.1 tripartite tricarboxylate transporter TctB family protein [Ancylobacter koreensis]